VKTPFSCALRILLGVSLFAPLHSIALGQTSNASDASGQIRGQPWVGQGGVQRKTVEIMSVRDASQSVRIAPRRNQLPDRTNRPQDVNAPRTAQWPLQKSLRSQSPMSSSLSAQSPIVSAPQIVSTTFDAATGDPNTGPFPPDTMGAIGPTQFFLFINGKLKTFSKATGSADAIIDANPDVFFSSVMTPAVAANSTSNPQIRYDRLTSRWILTIIDTPGSSAGTMGDTPNRILIAVSDAASAGIITGSTVWSFFFVQQNTVGGGNTGEFLDNPSLGVDNNALYIGGDMYTASSGTFVTTSGFVVRKSSVLGPGPVVMTAFRGLITAGEGPESPRGVDNYDPVANEGYFVGTSVAAFGRMILRRVGTPGGAPTMSANIPFTVPATSFPISVPHLGNTAGINGQLDSLDDRLFAAHIRNGRLWTAQNIAVDATGVAAGSGAGRRNAVRWYEFVVPVGSGTPTVNQSGTIFDSAASNPKFYWIPAVMVSGQGHAAFGFSIAGNNDRINAGTNGRLSGDSLGTQGAVQLYTNSSSAYNPPGDAGGPLGRRWGDYSFTSLDPTDDMTMWTIQEFCDGTNTWGTQAAKLLAPPPATPASANPPSVASGQSSVLVTITGTSTAGSGFFDPGPGFAHRIGATVTGGVTVNSVTYTDPTHVTLDLKTIGATGGAKNVTITNPDGQSATGAGILNITAGPLQLLSAASRKTHSPNAGTFDVDLPIVGPPFGIECRNSGGNHTLVFTFSNNVVSGSANVTSGTGTPAMPVFSGNTMSVDVTGATNPEVITMTLTNVTDTFAQTLSSASVSMNILIGDSSANKSVNASDISQVKAQSGAQVTAANFREDLTVNGTINASDVSIAKAKSGTGLP
jgi:hypothetical protein